MRTVKQPLMIGVRVELAQRIAQLDKLKAYNKTFDGPQILGIIHGGKIVVEKPKKMIVANGKKSEIGHTGLVTFSVMNLVTKCSEVERVVKIVNVLGNDRIIRERVITLVTNKSLLNGIPELNALVAAFKNLDSVMPGFIDAGWYYAPEASFG